MIGGSDAGHAGGGACFDSTLRMIDEHLGLRLESLEVKVDAECDVRGCLLVERTVPVGFQRMRCRSPDVRSSMPSS